MHKSKKFISQWYILTFFILILIFLLSLRKITGIDIGFHLKGGEWILENKSFHRYDVFTYTVNKNEYIAMYWLFQIFIYVAYICSGYSGLVLLNSFLIIICFILLILLLKIRTNPLWIISFLLFLSVFPTEIRFSIRPEVFTWIFLLLVIFILNAYFYKNKNYLFFFFL